MRFLCPSVICLLLFACDNSTFQGQTASSGAGISDESLRDRLEQRGIVDSDSLKLACETATNLGQVEASISFPETRECAWGQGENLQRRQAYVQAYGIQNQSVSLPEGAVVCQIQLQSKPGISLHYDDFLFFMLDQYVIFGTNQQVASYLEQEVNLYIWDFGKMRGERIRNFNAPAYCLAESGRCVLPPHDQIGPVAIDLNFEESSQIAYKIIDRTGPLNFSLVATGDDDDRDCYHTDLDLDVKINYLAL